jgi:hypothetical protein
MVKYFASKSKSDLTWIWGTSEENYFGVVKDIKKKRKKIKARIQLQL